MMDPFCDQTAPDAIPGTILKAYHGKTVLITGGRGYIGSALARSFADVDCRLILLDQSGSDEWKPEGGKAEVSLFHGDTSVRKVWDAALPGTDTVFHLAAREYFYRSEHDPEQDFRFNALPVLHLLEACRVQSHRPSIVFASSANLFGLVDTLPVNEARGDDPLTLWAVHKLAAERYLRIYARQFGIGSVTLRLANVYGPSSRWAVMDRVVINKMINRALNGEELVTYANRDCVRDYVFLQDVVQAFLHAGACQEATRAPVYVIGSGEGKTIADTWKLIADSVRSNTGRKVAIRWDPSVEVEPLELRSFVADSKRFRDATGWKSRTGLAQGIDATVRAFLTNQRRFS